MLLESDFYSNRCVYEVVVYNFRTQERRIIGYIYNDESKINYLIQETKKYLGNNIDIAVWFQLLDANEHPDDYMQRVDEIVKEWMMTETYGDKFSRLKRKWKRETTMQSSLSIIAEHPAHKELVAMGKIILPLIFEDMLHEFDPKKDAWYERFGNWELTLSAIVGHVIHISEDEMGKIDIIRERWLEWGRNNGYID